jgi:hypothetical protein
MIMLSYRIRPSVQEDGGDIFYVGFDATRGIVQVSSFSPLHSYALIHTSIRS